MFVVAQITPHGGDMHARDVDVPPIDEVPLGRGVEYTGVDGIPVDYLHLGESYALFEPG